MRRVKCLLPLLCAVALLLAGCDTRSSVEKADEEGVLLVGNGFEPQSFDPHKATAVADWHIIGTLLEGLVRGDAMEDDKVHPGVAESWEANEAKDVWTFRLREDARWSDGRPVTAHDFVYAYHRLLHPLFGGKYADMLFPLKNAEAYNKDWLRKELGGAGDLWEKAGVGVEAVDERTLRLTLCEPTPHLPLLLLHYTWFPVPAHAVEANGGMLDRSSEWTKPGKWVGNGAFVLAEYRFNDFVEVRRNPQYWRAGEVALNAVRFLPVVNAFTETRMFFDGKLHVTNNVPPEMLAYAKGKAPDAFCRDAYYCSFFYRLNTTRKPLDDVRVRMALALGVDRDALVDKVVRDAGTPATGFTPPGAGYETPDMFKDAGATQEVRVQTARRLLAEAGFPGGKGFPTLEIMTTSREVQKVMAEAIQAMWLENLGIHVEIRSCEWTAYKDAQQKLQYDISSSSWSGDYLDPATFVEMWSGGSGNNATGWSNGRFDAAVRRAHSSGKVEERLAALREAEETMLKEAPVVPLYWAYRTYLKRPEVKGWHGLLLDAHPYDAVYVEKEGKRDD